MLILANISILSQSIASIIITTPQTLLQVSSGWCFAHLFLAHLPFYLGSNCVRHSKLMQGSLKYHLLHLQQSGNCIFAVCSRRPQVSSVMSHIAYTTFNWIKMAQSLVTLKMLFIRMMCLTFLILANIGGKIDFERLAFTIDKLPLSGRE